MLDIKLKLRAGHTSERAWMRPSPLKTLFWNITYACNYRCGICFTDAGERGRDELTTEQALETVEKIHQAGVHDLILSGGEPFLRPDIIPILRHMAKFGISVRIASNGSLLDVITLRRLRDETLTKSFQISLDTIDADLYGQFHGSSADSFGRVLQNLDQIQAHGFHTTISVRLTPQTLPGIPGLLDFAREQGLATVTIHCPVHTQRIKDAFPQDEDVFTRLEPVFDHFCSLPQKWLVETYIPWAEYHPVIHRLQRQVRVVNRGCRAGRDRLTINPTGSISPCVCMDIAEAYLGDIENGDLESLFQNSSLCKLLRDPQEHGICSECAHLSRCGGGCRAAALAMTGRLDGQDMSCPVWQRRNQAVSRRP
jgi:radical SAM protein with 4Fe4S-binding SPASM domain